MDKAIKDDNLGFLHRCPKHKTILTGMTVTHPWRLYCHECKKEYENPDHPEYYQHTKS